MKYAVYFTWKEDSFDDTFNVESAKERDMNIAEMIQRNVFDRIEYCPIYANGEYGMRKKVL